MGWCCGRQSNKMFEQSQFWGEIAEVVGSLFASTASC